MRKRTARTKKYDREGSKKRLLNAALDIFSRHGYDAATTRAIAKRARVNDSLIQRYFGGKRGLLISLIHRFQTLMKETSFTSGDEGLDGKIEGFFIKKLAFSKRHRKFLRIVVARAIVDSKVRAEMAKFSKNGSPDLNFQLEGLLKEGRISNDLELKDVTRFLNVIPVTVSLLSECVGGVTPVQGREIFKVAAKIISRGLSP